MTIQINPEKGVIVRVPARADERNIRRFIDEKQDWINKTISRQEQLKAKAPTSPSYLGEPLEEAQIQQFRSHRHMADWYKKKAQNYLEERTKIFAKMLDQRPPSRIKIRSYKSRWGSCDRYNNISYNWKVMMTKPEIIDYLVAHEVSHMVNKNHSKSFYKTLVSLDPDHKIHRKALREFRPN